MITTEEELEFALLSLDAKTVFQAARMPAEIAELAGYLYPYMPVAVRQRLTRVFQARDGLEPLKARAEVVRQRLSVQARAAYKDTGEPAVFHYASALVQSAIASLDYPGADVFATMSWARVAEDVYPALRVEHHAVYRWTGMHEKKQLLRILDAWVAV